ncbi:MAG: 50S ribosomal protein L11 methyltransferase [Spirochaetia bacterium]|nr:50S ribosomal protein L11 methyltransferase [Spirochaetia bacterium]
MNSDYYKKIFWELRIEIPKDKADLVEEFNLKSGALGFHEILYEEDKIQNIENAVQYYYFSFEFPIKAYIVMMLALLKIENCPYIIQETKYENFLKNMKETFRSFEIAKHFWIVPEWEAEELVPKYSKEDHFVILRPAFAFGTGLHETTKLMIEMLTDNKYGVYENDRILDMGTGSGILSIAALELNAHEAVGVDIDTLSVESANENLKLNLRAKNFSGKAFFYKDNFSFYHSYYKNRPKPDLFISNIFPEAFMANADILKDILSQTQRVILSGIVEDRAEEFEKWLTQIAPQRKFTSKNLRGWFVFFSNYEIN